MNDYVLNVYAKQNEADAKILRLERRRLRARHREWNKRAAERDSAFQTNALYTRAEAELQSVEDRLTNMSRALHLARMYLRDVPYAEVEEIHYSEPNWEQVFEFARQSLVHQSLVRQRSKLNVYEMEDYDDLLWESLLHWAELGTPLGVTPKPKRMRPTRGSNAFAPNKEEKAA